MLIISAKLNPKKAIFCVILCACALIVLILLCGVRSRQTAPGHEPVVAPTDQQRTEYLRSLGWETEPSPTEILEFVLPRPLNASYEEYNQLQLEQGFDLAPYAGMNVTRYSYPVTNHPKAPQQVQANLYLCGDTIIGGDILCYGENGFVDTLVFPG